MWNQLYFYRYILVKETFMAKSAKDFPTSSFVVALPHTARLRKDNHLTAMHQIHFFYIFQRFLSVQEKWNVCGGGQENRGIWAGGCLQL